MLTKEEEQYVARTIKKIVDATKGWEHRDAYNFINEKNKMSFKQAQMHNAVAFGLLDEIQKLLNKSK